MAVDVRVDGVAEWRASSVAVGEDSTPLDPSDTFGGVGAVTLTVPEGIDAKSLLGRVVEITDSDRGLTVGVVAAASGRNRLVKVETLTRLSALVTDQTADPHVGTLESLLLYYFGLCGVTDDIVIDETIGATEVVAPGWFGNVWLQVKKLTAAYNFEVAVVGSDIVIRSPRGVTASRRQESAFEWSLDQSDMAQTVEAWYYECEPITDGLVVGNAEAPVVNVDAGEVQEYTVRIDASVSSVVQPVAMDSVSYDEASASVYAVLDQWDEPVDPDYWRDNGGYVSVEIGEDTRSLMITVVGCQERSLAPYRLVGFADDGSEYSTIRVVGTGVTVARGKYVLPAAVDAAAEVGAEVDNEFLSSWGHAHLALLPTAGRYGTAVQRISGEAGHVAEVDGQAYGHVAGARVFEDFNVYRVRAATTTPAAVSYTAEPDLTFDDVDDLLAGHTFDEWDDLWLGRPFDEFDLRPLTPLEGEVTPPTGGFGSGVFGGPPVFGG